MKKTIFAINSIFILLCLISLYGGLVYRVYSLNLSGIAISLTLALISFIIIQYICISANKSNRPAESKSVTRQEEKNPGNKVILLKYLLIAGYGVIVLLILYILFNNRTSEAIISPWQVLPKYFFILYTLASLLLIGNIFLNRKIALLLIMLHYFLSFSVALIVYRIGYGYDSFIHQTTESLIDKIGAVEPKPFYYLGQYGLVVILHKITSLSLVWLDRLLVPLSAAIILPLTLWRVLNAWFFDKRHNLFLIFSLLSLTFPFLIVTTPQNLAYLLLIIIILLGLTCKNHYDFYIILLLSLTALIIQPIAGLPALLFCLLLAIYYQDKNKFKVLFYSLTVILTIIILPLSFYILERKMSSSSETNITVAATDIVKNYLPGQENFILNFIYLYGNNLEFVLLLLLLSGIIIAWKFKNQCKIFFIYLIMSLALLASYFIASRIPFAFLINYERSDYPDRILLVASLFLLPFVIISIYAILEKILLLNTFFKLSWVIFITVLLSTSLYLTYPRFDNYYNSRGFSVSDADINSVNWINENSKNNFIVLANQQVSAAALNQFGFKKYYLNGRNQIFYYPIPTSSPLYQYYLDMVYKKPSRETMSAAMVLTGVNESYFVLNKYWWAFAKILAEAKLSANSWKEINNGEVYIFKYVE